MEEPKRPLEKAEIAKDRLLRCVDWLHKQNSQEPKKLSLQNKNDIQFIIQTNADRKKFLLSAAEDEATVPPGVDEPDVEPKVLSLKKLRVEELRMECEWQSCGWVFHDYTLLQKHMKDHISDVHIIEDGGTTEYVCLWDVCGHKTADFQEMIRHIHYHSYHSRLLAIGFNGRATLKLPRCKKDSTKRNQLPMLKCDHVCMWTGCTEKYQSIQAFFDHVHQHVNYSESHLCSWGGCGATFPRRGVLLAHVRSHTCEKLIACFHCGMHFSCNRKLTEHLQRQNVYPGSAHACSVCGQWYASEYLLREHARQHIGAHACALCDMSAHSPHALAHHYRYRHFAPEDARVHACPHCPYKAVTKSDLRMHILTHTRKKKSQIKKEQDSDKELSDEDEQEIKPKKKSNKKYACHMCPEKQTKVFSRGSRLTTHLVKVHGVQWPCGHSRFRYQISEDGMYRLTTTRYEFLEVSRQIVDGYPKESIKNTFEFNLELKAEATECTPKSFEITLKNNDATNEVGERKESKKSTENSVEITMCDVDEQGNIINSEIIKSDVVYSKPMSIGSDTDESS